MARTHREILKSELIDMLNSSQNRAEKLAIAKILARLMERPYEHKEDAKERKQRREKRAKKSNPEISSDRRKALGLEL
jgi:hypothetical protein